MNALFALESNLDGLPPEERLSKRKENAEPILTEFLQWLEGIHPAPKFALGRAVAYTLQQCPWLTNYLLDGRLELFNNCAERSIKPFVMGRKNFFFANSLSGATTSAIIYSLFETARENRLEPCGYLTWLMRQAPALDLTDAAQAELLMPVKELDLSVTLRS